MRMFQHCILAIVFQKLFVCVVAFFIKKQQDILDLNLLIFPKWATADAYFGFSVSAYWTEMNGRNSTFSKFTFFLETQICNYCWKSCRHCSLNICELSHMLYHDQNTSFNQNVFFPATFCQKLSFSLRFHFDDMMQLCTQAKWVMIFTFSS